MLSYQKWPASTYSAKSRMVMTVTMSRLGPTSLILTQRMSGTAIKYSKYVFHLIVMRVMYMTERVITVGIAQVLLASATSGFSSCIKLAYYDLVRLPPKLWFSSQNNT